VWFKFERRDAPRRVPGGLRERFSVVCFDAFVGAQCGFSHVPASQREDAEFGLGRQAQNMALATVA